MMKGKFAKTSKVSKYYETDCRQNHEQKGEKKVKKEFSLRTGIDKRFNKLSSRFYI